MPRNRYPWDEWCDGEEHTIVQGIDFHVSPKQMRHVLYGRCQRRWMWVTTSISDRFVWNEDKTKVLSEHNAITFKFTKEWQDGNEDEN
jgi:hypothetical protein